MVQSIPNKALEVVVNGESGPLSGVVVELQHEGTGSSMSMRTNASGLARFEGLAPTDLLTLRLLHAASWSVANTQKLSASDASSSFDAVWSGPSGQGKRHTVAQGECIWTVAQRHGLDAEAVWKANTALQTKARDPNMLAPDDVVELGGDTPSSRVDVRPATRVVIDCTPAVARAQLRFHDPLGKPRAGIEFLICSVDADGAQQAWTGTLDRDGALDEQIAASATTLEITLTTDPEPEVYHFCLAHLDPVDTLSGVQGRLFNLGYYCGDERGELGPLTRRALREFQTEHGLTVSEEPDQATRDKLVELY